MTTDTQNSKQKFYFPYFDLKQIIEKAIKIYDIEKRKSIDPNTFFNHLGLKPDSGHARRIAQALKLFDLINKDSLGNILINQIIEYYKYSPTEQDKTKILQKIALTPSLFSELYKKYPNSNIDKKTISFDLISNYNLTPDAAMECVKSYIATIEYAQLSHNQLEDHPLTNQQIQSLNTKLIQPSIQTINQNPPADTIINKLNSPNSQQPTLNPSLNNDKDFINTKNINNLTTPSFTIPPNIIEINNLDVSNLVNSNFETIPVRLSDTKRAFIVIPKDLTNSDIQKIQKQIELLFLEIN